MKKALDMWGWNEGHLQLDPKTVGWPSLSFYIHLAVQHLQFAVGSIAGNYHDRYDFMVANAVDKSGLLLWARWVGVLCAGLVVFLGSRLAFRLSGVWGALLVGGSLALSPMLVRHAQLVTPDILLTLFSALALVAAMRVYGQGRVRDYVWSGLLLGLGIACKYTPVLFALGLFFVHLMRLKQEGAPLGQGGLTDRRLALAALACVGAFLLTSPYTFSDLAVLRRDFGYQALHMSQGHFGQEHSAPGIVYYVRDVLGPGLGWPAFLFGLLGLGLGAWRLGGPWRALVLYSLPFLVGILSLSTKFERYMLPALLPLALGLAAWPALLSRRPSWNAPLRRKLVLGVLLLACVIPAASGVAAYHRAKATRGSMQVAREWMTEILLPRDAALAMESYTPRVPGDRREALRREPFFARLSEAQKARLLERLRFRTESIPMNSVRLELIEYYYDLRHYLPFDYIVTSSSVRGRYEAVPERFPQQMEFYADLERYAELEREFGGGDGLSGPQLRFYRFTEEGKRRLIEDKGALPPRHYLEYRDKLHAPQFTQFVRGVAKRAEEAEQWSVAAHYLDALVDTTGRKGSQLEQRLALLERSGLDHLRAQEYELSLERLNEFLQLGPRDARVLGYRAQALEKLGRLQEAYQGYLECEAEARKLRGEQAWVDWAEKRREAVEAAIRESGK